MRLEQGVRGGVRLTLSDGWHAKGGGVLCGGRGEPYPINARRNCIPLCVRGESKGLATLEPRGGKEMIIEGCGCQRGCLTHIQYSASPLRMHGNALSVPHLLIDLD